MTLQHNKKVLRFNKKKTPMEMENYKVKIKGLILKKLERDYCDETKKSNEKKNYRMVHQASTTFGTIWEIAIFNWDNWTRIKIMDGKSDELEVHMELKNKPTTINSSQKEGIRNRLRKFEIKNPGYRSVIGYVHDSRNRETVEEYNDEFTLTIYHYGGDSLFKNIFGEYADEVRNFVNETIISFYEEKGYRPNRD